MKRWSICLGCLLVGGVVGTYVAGPRLFGQNTDGSTDRSAVVTNIPKDFGPDFNWEKQELVPMQSTILLNRAGKYTVVVEARDELAKKTVKLTYDLKVIDTGK